MDVLRNASVPLNVCALALAVAPLALGQEADPESALTWLGQDAVTERYISGRESPSHDASGPADDAWSMSFVKAGVCPMSLEYRASCAR